MLSPGKVATHVDKFLFLEIPPSQLRRLWRERLQECEFARAVSNSSPAPHAGDACGDLVKGKQMWM